ncbi:STAS domain-containing protein [Streptomyces sp. NPDC001621]|uniref:STAS domain-containing protein n=1 Tax=Streptomyces sp. NPDC001621 TaxID=3364594 RepID=UPI0036CF1027
MRARQTAQDTYVIEVDGELDHHTTGQLDEAIDHALTRGAAAVLIDLQPTTFLDSSGLNALLTAHRAAARAGARLALIAPSAAVHRMLSLTGVDRVLPTCPTTEAALP